MPTLFFLLALVVSLLLLVLLVRAVLGAFVSFVSGSVPGAIVRLVWFFVLLKIAGELGPLLIKYLL